MSSQCLCVCGGHRETIVACYGTRLHREFRLLEVSGVTDELEKERERFRERRRKVGVLGEKEMEIMM